MSRQGHPGGLGQTTTYRATRLTLLSVGRVLGLLITNLPFIGTTPLGLGALEKPGKPGVKPPSDPRLWIYLGIAVILVLLGGVFAGLTIALMGQDDVNLQVIYASGEGKEKNHAGSVLKLLQRGKHWVLVTLLLSNVITNETLPIVLDRSLGGGWPAVLSSTALIVIFGEIIPQSICVRYGLPIGAWMAPLVLGLMYVLGPIAWPTAKLLDRLLGEDHGTVYKKAGLKTLVTLHKTLGTSASERLNQDEVTIISAVLDLKDKPVGSIMTPMEDTFTMSGDTVLDEKMMDVILSAGYSRIPIHAPDNDQNFIGMLLVKTLITYDPEDAKRVSDFALATLPETRPETSCLDIVNFFQEGKSHMVLVSECPGENHGALGVVTLEDVIEELIGEEIIDESDVYVDVHNAVRRKAPAPKVRLPRLPVLGSIDNKSKKANEGIIVDADGVGKRTDDAADEQSRGRFPTSVSEYGTSPRGAESTRGPSSTVGSRTRGAVKRGSTGDLRDQRRHWGPSNLATKPRQTRYNSVKIKSLGGSTSEDSRDNHRRSSTDASGPLVTVPENGVKIGLLGSADKDGTSTSQGGYGTITESHMTVHLEGDRASDQVDETSQPTPLSRRDSRKSRNLTSPLSQRYESQSPKTVVVGVRSGNITENIIEAGGVRKLVLQANSSSEDAGGGSQRDDAGEQRNGDKKEDGDDQDEGKTASGGSKKKRRRKKRRNAGGEGGSAAEESPLLGRDGW